VTTRREDVTTSWRVVALSPGVATDDGDLVTFYRYVVTKYQDVAAMPLRFVTFLVDVATL
jgi:hypothetical protein